MMKAYGGWEVQLYKMKLKIKCNINSKEKFKIKHNTVPSISE